MPPVAILSRFPGTRIMSVQIERFDQLALPAPILKSLEDVGYETPSPIQAACIPPLLAGHDLIGQAQTGTGKTAAFALPILAQLDLAQRQPQALVLAPTRELAIQVAEAFQSYAKHLPGFHVLPLYGGQSMFAQLRQLERGAHVVIGTPGRIMDHLERQSLSLASLRTLVLDEADEMLRMGFIDDVEWILEHTPATRQTLLFSATMPEPIRRVAHRHLREALEVKIQASTTTIPTIRQRYWQVSGVHKLDALTRILEVEQDFDAALIFVRTKTATVELAEKLEARGYNAAALNGDMPQPLRERVIDQLKMQGLDIVVATDVAARGIDVARITHVINYDIPYDTESYVHRIGRTGRAGRAGTAILFVAPRETRMLRAIERATRQPIEPLVLPSKQAVANRRIEQFKQQVMAVINSEELGFFTDVIEMIEQEQNIDARQIAAALACMVQRERPLQLEDAPAAPHKTAGANAIPSVSSAAPGLAQPLDRGRESARPRPNPTASTPRQPAVQPAAQLAPQPFARSQKFSQTKLVRYRIGVGRNQQVAPKDIVGAIANEAGIESRYIGRIELYADYSVVELPDGLPEETLAVLRQIRVRNQPFNLRRVEEARPGGSSGSPGEKFRGQGAERSREWERKPFAAGRSEHKGVAGDRFEGRSSGPGGAGKGFGNAPPARRSSGQKKPFKHG